MIDLQNKVFSRLTVTRRGPNRPNGQARWFATCDCGTKGLFNSDKLISGHTRSCGCLQREAIANTGKLTGPIYGKINGYNNRKHGHSINSRTYRSWCSMKARCSNPNGPDWHLYGGKGILVCPRWINPFQNFLDDLGERPEGTSLDRINSNGNYEASNCRWATPKQQGGNGSRRE